MSKHLLVRTVHRDASRLLLPALGALFITAGGLALVRHRPARLLWPILAGGMVLAASFTGYLLPWDQLALRRVTVDENFRGYLFHHDVKFVLIDRKEIQPSTLARWLWVHAIGTTSIVLALLVVIGLLTRQMRGRSTPDAGVQE